ncbi:Haloacid dehalogenase-like hydrolase domain-containing protein 3 [Coemansia nantahalensis]|nr:Haloacid dehalogenase-like hydrolase domain-containing protein 3 [Coemansia nantahalensis]
MARRLSNIRLVTFDLYDTLYTPRDPIGVVYTEPLRRLGIDVSEATMRRGFAEAHKHMRAHYPNYGFGLMSSHEWWQQVVARAWRNAGVSAAQLASSPLVAAREGLIRRFATDEGYRMYDDVPGLLRYVRRRGIKTGVISNMDEAAESVLDGLGIRSYFDFVLKSVTAGIEKPNPRIFEMALDAVSIPPYDALHVGDSEALDYAPARGVGMEARIVCRGPDAARLVAEHPDKYIASLGALARIV